MAYSIVPYVNPSNSWTAAQHNTYIRDNMAAIWPYYVAGDMAIASSASVLQRVPIGSDGQIFTVKNGIASWSSYYSLITCLVGKTSQSIPAASWTDISFDTIYKNDLDMFSSSTANVVTCKRTGIYNISGTVRYANDSTQGRELKINISNDSSPGYIDSVLAGNETTNNFSIPASLTTNNTVTVSCYSGTALTVNVTLCLTFWGA